MTIKSCGIGKYNNCNRLTTIAKWWFRSSDWELDVSYPISLPSLPLSYSMLI